MSQIYKGILGALALSLMFGAVQFASGHDLIGQPAAPAAAAVPETSINRAAKSDRADLAAAPSVQTQTMTLKIDSLADTSILIRVPVPKEARGRPATSLMTKSGDRKMVIACEPVVSVLTEVAKQLQPGRCVT